MNDEKENVVENETETEAEAFSAEQAENPGEVTIKDDDILNALKNPSQAVKEFLEKYAKDAVKAALANSTPKKSTVRVEPITKEKFEEMSYSEREKLFNENRDLYNKLTK